MDTKELAKPVRRIAYNPKPTWKKKLPPASIANLTPYAKGTNGHKGGYSLTLRLRHALEKQLAELPTKNATVGELLVHSTLKGALLREPTPFREVWDRLEGKVPDNHAILGDITVEVTYVNRDRNTTDDTG